MTKHTRVSHLGLFLLALALFTPPLRAADLAVTATPNTDQLRPQHVFELTFQHDNKYPNPTWDVTIDLKLASPSGKQYEVGGFFYGSSKPQTFTTRQGQGRKDRALQYDDWTCDPADLWKARFAPIEDGLWKYTWSFANNTGGQSSGQGEFTVVAGKEKPKGWITINRKVRQQFLLQGDKTPFYPVGWQDCMGDSNHSGTMLDTMMLEGPFGSDPEGKKPKTPPGPLFARGPSIYPHNADVYFRRHAYAGFNLWRFSPNNCTPLVFTAADDYQPGLDRVQWKEAAMVDEMYQMVRKYDIRIMHGIFGFTRAFNDEASDAEKMAQVKRIIKYSVDRWGAYVDIWELLNEQVASDDWYRIATDAVRAADPYKRLVTSSWDTIARQRNEARFNTVIPGLDIESPHIYQSESELITDLVTAEQGARVKQAGRPVIYGEHGNHISAKHRAAAATEGNGGNWEPSSARRLRVRLWTGLMNNISFIFWETSGRKDVHLNNQWIGPLERQYIRALQGAATYCNDSMFPVVVPLDGPQAAKVRSYSLRSSYCQLVYLHHGGCAECDQAVKADLPARHKWDHQRGKVEGLRLHVDVANPGKGYWYDPATAAILGTFDAPLGGLTVLAPPFDVDLALIISPDGPPDIDGDGIPNDIDEDDDNDGVPDAKDAFPLEREEWADADADMIGDNQDADIGGDGIGDDKNGNGTPDHEEMDFDGDGVPRAGSVPWDAFPNDPKEWRDTDGDGIGDNADTDDDNDGFTDEEEIKAGTDPLNALSFPKKTD